MKIRNVKNNVENNVENTIRSILLDDGHFLFRIKKKNTSPTWSYFDTKNKKGITLIALIITIILMLILAGVVISLTLGENGIFNIAKHATEETKKVQIQEKIQLAVTDIITKYIAEENQITNTLLKQEIEKYASLKGITIAKDLTGTYEGYKFYIDEKYDVHIGENDEKNREKLVNIITPEDYGKKINYSANGVNDWKVFYNDGKNVYIIASDYLNISSIETPLDFTKMQMTNSNNYMICWNQNVETNIEAAGILANTNNWSAFASGKGGETATGGPTYEMLADSWNQNSKTNSVILNSSGYIGGLNDLTELYILNDNNLCQGYWLSSTNNVYLELLYMVGCGDGIYYNDFHKVYHGLRPVVCLNANATGKVGNTVVID